MEALVLQNVSQTGFSWLSFFAVVGAMVLGVVVVFSWILFFGNKRKRKRRHHGHGRIKPTLAEVGGLPPVRTGDAKPAVENPPFDP